MNSGAAPGSTSVFNLVVAADRKRGIGREGKLPWRLKGDMRFFRELSTCPDSGAVRARYGLNGGLQNGGVGGDVGGATPLESLARTLDALDQTSPLPVSGSGARNAVIMGRKTWESLPAAFRPLPHRSNGVISRSLPPGPSETHTVWSSLPAALRDVTRDGSIRNIFVIGGRELFAEALARPDCGRVYLTAIDAVYPCDVFLPEIPEDFRETGRASLVVEGETSYRFKILERAPI